MNEKLKNLASSAGFARCDNDDFLSPYREDIDISGLLENFAESIICECAEVAGCNGHVSGFALGDLIKKHFEVDA